VKTVAPHALFAKRARQREARRDRGLAMMEAGVEAGDLQHSGAQPGDGADRGEIMGLMQWRQWAKRLERGEEWRVDPRRR